MVLSQNLSHDFNECFIPFSAYRDDHVAPANRRRRNSMNTRTPSPTITSSYSSYEVNFTTPEYGAAQRRFAQRPLDLGGATDQVFLILFGTGFRNHRGLPGVNLWRGGVAVPVQFAGAAPGDPGRDEINAALPRGLTGRGEMDVVLMV